MLLERTSDELCCRPDAARDRDRLPTSIKAACLIGFKHSKCGCERRLWSPSSTHWPPEREFASTLLEPPVWRAALRLPQVGVFLFHLQIRQMFARKIQDIAHQFQCFFCIGYGHFRCGFL